VAQVIWTEERIQGQALHLTLVLLQFAKGYEIYREGITQ
jgi:hypothetical protein